MNKGLQIQKTSRKDIAAFLKQTHVPNQPRPSAELLLEVGKYLIDLNEEFSGDYIQRNNKLEKISQTAQLPKDSTNAKIILPDPQEVLINPLTQLGIEFQNKYYTGVKVLIEYENTTQRALVYKNQKGFDIQDIN